MISESNIHLLQWNILSRSEIFCSTESFPRVDKAYLDWNYRAELFKKIFNNTNPDILCLQEVDDYEEFKTNLVSSEKYNSEYFKKNEGLQGIAFFYTKDKFDLLKIDKVNLPKDEQGLESNQFFIYAFLKVRQTHTVFVVISTHLKAKAEFEKVRFYQVKYILEYIDKNAEFADLYNYYDSKGIIVCGDFNAEPEYSCIQYLMNYKFNTLSQLANTSLVSAYNFSDQKKDDLIEMTTFKFREKENYRVIDYIFYSQNIKFVETTPTIKKSEIKFLESDISDVGLPCGFFPSDHYYLNIIFNFNKN